MNRLFRYILLFSLLTFFMTAQAVNAQSIRTEAMSGLTYAVSDTLNSLGLFHFAGNPAFMKYDEKYSSLIFYPSAGSIEGNYRRQYEARSISDYSLAARNIIHLGSKGIFLGYAGYEYEKRSDVFRALRYDNYAGDAFFQTDSSAGNFSYNTTSAGFRYSYEPLENFTFGAGADYSISEGLKDKYSHTRGLIRFVNAQMGLGYRFSEKISAGTSFSLFDSQETIELKSIETVTSGVMNYSGEKYFTVIDDNFITEKIRQQGIEGSVHFTYSPLKEMQFSVSSEFRQYNSVLLTPFAQEKESERGYAYFEKFNLRSRMFYQMTENFSLGARMEYRSSYSWSKNSHRSLTLWDWTVKGTHLGAGFSYYFRPSKLLIGAELELMPVNADSVKYIDNRTFSDGALNGSLRVGAEYEAFNDIYLRGGIIAGSDRWDFNRGMQEMKTEGFSFGIAGRFPGFADIDITAVYIKRAPFETIAGAEDIFKIYRKDFRIAASIKLYRF